MDLHSFALYVVLPSVGYVSEAHDHDRKRLAHGMPAFVTQHACILCISQRTACMHQISRLHTQRTASITLHVSCARHNARHPSNCMHGMHASNITIAHNMPASCARHNARHSQAAAPALVLTGRVSSREFQKLKISDLIACMLFMLGPIRCAPIPPVSPSLLLRVFVFFVAYGRAAVSSMSYHASEA